MGFLDKAVKAAATAKVQFDDLRETRAAASVTPVEAAPLGDHEQQVVQRARAGGAPDPTLLLTRHEAMEVTGQPLGGPHLIYGDDSIGVKFEARGLKHQRWRVEVSAFHGIDDDHEFDAAAHWHSYLADMVADDARAVPGLGEVALQRESDLFVLADPLLLMIAVQTPEPEGDQERAVAVARQVVARLLT